MSRSSLIQSAFSSGEISPLLAGRHDYQRFQTGLAACNGFLPLRQGGFTRAPGTLWRGSTRGDASARLIGFQFAQNDAVVLEFSALKMRVWRYGELVDDGGSPYELDTPYDGDAIWRLDWVQSADVIYLVDGALPIQKLSRLALDNWSIEAAAFDTGPFRVQNLDETVTIQASATTGTVTLTASSGIFQAGHVGALFRLQPLDLTAIPLWSGNEALSVGAQRRYGDNVYELTAGTNSGVNPPIHTEGTQKVDGNGATWKFLNDGKGIVRITAFASATSVTGEVLKTLSQDVVSTASYRWEEGAWSDVNGYPAAIEIYDQRLVAAATPRDPRTVWFSAGGGFEDMEPSIEADGAFAYSIAGRNSQNRIVWLREGSKALYAGALGEEYSTQSTDGNTIIGPTTTRFSLDSSIGSRAAKPIAPGGWPIFISKDGARLFELRYSFQDDANEPRELSLPSDHLGNDGFAEIQWTSSPLRLAWIRRESGDLAVMVHEPSEDVLGWAPCSVAGGIVESIAVTPDETGAYDVVTLIVRRTIDGATVRLVEEQALIYGVLKGAQPITDAVHFFAAGEFDEEPAVSVFNLPHLVGEEVHAWTDQGALGPFTVPEGGALDIETPCTRAVIGLLDETHAAELLNLHPPARDGDTTGRKVELLPLMGVRVHRTAAGEVMTVERDLENPERVSKPQSIVPVPFLEPRTKSYSGIASLQVPSGMAEEVTLRFRPVSGAPMTVLATAPAMSEAGI